MAFSQNRTNMEISSVFVLFQEKGFKVWNYYTPFGTNRASVYTSFDGHSEGHESSIPICNGVGNDFRAFLAGKQKINLMFKIQGCTFTQNQRLRKRNGDPERHSRTIFYVKK